MSTFTYKYGAYEHDPGEIIDFQWQEEAHHTERGWRDTSTTTAVLSGLLLGNDRAEISTKIEKLRSAYEYNQKVFGLYDPDDVATRYVMDPTNWRLLIGPRVSVLDWPVGSMEEMVVKRAFKITVTGIWASQESEIIQYHENIANTGTTGPWWRSQNIVNGEPQAYAIWPKTTQKIVQEGYSLGFSGYYLAGATPNPLIPSQYEHLDQREEKVAKPLHLGRDWVYFPASWRYVFEVPNYTFVLPQ